MAQPTGNVTQPEDHPVPKPNPPKVPSHFILDHTVKKPPSAYAQLELVAADSALLSPHPAEEDTPVAGTTNPTLDALQLRAYLTSALTHFLGASGSAMAVDVLQIRGAEAWVRVPREDLPPFAAAIAAWPGTAQEGRAVALRVRAAGNWLGSLLGRNEQRSLWG